MGAVLAGCASSSVAACACGGLVCSRTCLEKRKPPLVGRLAGAKLWRGMGEGVIAVNCI
jgi:hypothetical protein